MLLLLFAVSICFAAPNGENSALVVIDMQDYFTNRNGFQKKPENQKKVNQIISAQLAMIDQARKLNVPIILIEYDCKGCGTTNERIKKAIAKYPKVKVIKKDTDGMFEDHNRYKKELVKYLEKEKIGTLVITGANGGACVLESIVGAVTNKYEVVAVTEGIADFNYEDFIYPYENHYNKLSLRSIKEVSSVREANQALGPSKASAASAQKNKSENIR
ncbi:Isochorismatase family protein [compost metagenome]